VIYVGVAEAFCYGGGEILEFFFGEGQGGDDFVVDGFVHEALDGGVFHAVTDDVLAGEVGSQYHGGVCSIEYAYFALFVGFVVVCYEDGEACFFEGEFGADGLGAFDNPEAEDFSCVHDVVFVAVFFVQRGGFCSGEAGYDAINEGGAEGVFFLEPLDKVLAEVPLGRVFQDAFFQFFSVVVYQFAGEDEEAFARLAAEGLESVV